MSKEPGSKNSISASHGHRQALQNKAQATIILICPSRWCEKRCSLHRDLHAGHGCSLEDYEQTSTNAIGVIRLSNARWRIESQVLQSTWEYSVTEQNTRALRFDYKHMYGERHSY
jgi:hypothetical protein